MACAQFNQPASPAAAAEVHVWGLLSACFCPLPASAISNEPLPLPRRPPPPLPRTQVPSLATLCAKLQSEMSSRRELLQAYADLKTQVGHACGILFGVWISGCAWRGWVDGWAVDGLQGRYCWPGMPFKAGQ